MTRTDKQRQRLIVLLEELFQIDQPDLDFGFYKIMHAKAETVSNFVHKDLLEITKDAFDNVDDEEIERARLKYEQAVEQAKSFNAPDPEATEPVQKAKAVYDAVKDSGANEVEVYEHLYRFFERYYDNGDFMSRRYFARETSSKASPYSIPYDGSEVHLHWANQDQYYIKTSEYLTNFTFDIAKSFTQKQRTTFKMGDSLKLHCRIVDASEGEHDNNKTNDKTERFFVIYPDAPVVLEDGELVLQFEYRPDNERSGTSAKWQEKRIDEAESTILRALIEMSEAEQYNYALCDEIDDDRNKRTMLRKYLNQYTKRNTTDYFIHKDLGSFLKRELDFYIKNEIMHLDDIESADFPHVEAYLDKIKVLRKIAMQLIDFLTQLEEFQKKLWLKKKFVTETQYCITLDRIPEAMYAEIASNEAQRQEWITLFAIDELDGYSDPLTLDFLKANPFLVLDTAFFTSDFKDAIIAGIQNFDKSLDGLLIHSENFQALGLMQEKMTNYIDSIYIDPPYNTSASEIIYKNSYKHSSWLSLMDSRIEIGRKLIKSDGVQCTTIDDLEYHKLRELLISHFFEDNILGTTVIKNNPSGRSTVRGFSIAHEYGIFSGKSSTAFIGRLDRTDKQKNRYKEQDDNGFFEWVNFRKHGGTRDESESMFYPIYINGKNFRFPEMVWDKDKKEWDVTDSKEPDEIEILPIDEDGKERRWKWGLERSRLSNDEFSVRKDKNGNPYLYVKSRMNNEGTLPLTCWDKKEYSSTAYGTNYLKSMFGDLNTFSYPKSIHAVMDTLKVMDISADRICLDYFAGSGTTGDAITKLNRLDQGRRKYILVEMGNYFDAVTRPRMQKVVHSQDWEDGKPVKRDGISHAFKYIRLESYEDTLNNLSFKENDTRNLVLQDNEDFRRDYMLKYWLEFETRGSPSLLNIDHFDDPTSYKLNLKKSNSNEYEEKAVDVVESFNWLIGLHIDHLDQWQGYDASFKREPDPELPKDETTRLILDGDMKESKDGKWLFRKVKGRVCRNPGDMNNTDRVLIIWRKLTGNLEEDNLMLDEWFEKHIYTEDNAFDVIYVNGSNNLQNLRQNGEQWETRLIEEAFHQKMWDTDE